MNLFFYFSSIKPYKGVENLIKKCNKIKELIDFKFDNGWKAFK